MREHIVRVDLNGTVARFDCVGNPVRAQERHPERMPCVEIVRIQVHGLPIALDGFFVLGYCELRHALIVVLFFRHDLGSLGGNAMSSALACSRRSLRVIHQSGPS